MRNAYGAREIPRYRDSTQNWKEGSPKVPRSHTEAGLEPGNLGRCIRMLWVHSRAGSQDHVKA